MAFSRVSQAYQQLNFEQKFVGTTNIEIETADTVFTLIMKINTALRHEHRYDVIELFCKKAPLFKFLERKGSEKLDVGLLLSHSKDDKHKLSKPLRKNLACGSLLVNKIFKNKHSKHEQYEYAYKAVFENDKKLQWLTQKDKIKPVDFICSRSINLNDLQIFWSGISKKTDR